MFSDQYMAEVSDIADFMPTVEIEKMADALAELREAKGRLFVIGLGGSASNAVHMAADLRKLCDIEASAPNEAEQSAWINDSGQEYAFRGHINWMKSGDALMVLSVGGGTQEVSKALMVAVGMVGQLGGKVFAIVGPVGGYTALNADVVIKVPASTRVTPHTEAFQAVIWHCLVSHPKLQRNATKW